MHLICSRLNSKEDLDVLHPSWASPGYNRVACQSKECAGGTDAASQLFKGWRSLRKVEEKNVKAGKERQNGE